MYRKIVVQRVTHKFREAIRIDTVRTPKPGPSEILVKNRFLGINASDINYTAGRYDPTVKPPFDCGFEAVGEVVETGDGCSLKTGQPVGYMVYGAFAEYILLPAEHVMPLPDVKPEYVSVMVSGLTAAISLDKVGEIKPGETVLITAAAGGTGQMAIQWAKAAGCHVIGTCSTDEKVDFLRSLGCDRPINYSKEDLRAVLKNEYPKGIDVIYESVGGDMFDMCVDHLALKGRLILLGFITGYDTAKGIARSRAETLPPKLLLKSASVRGFFLFQYRSDIGVYFAQLVNMVARGEIKSSTDNGINSEKGPFKGIEKIPDAVDYLYSRKSKGKIVVELPDTVSKM